MAGARLALFLPLRAFDFRVSPLDYALLVAVQLRVVWVAAAALRAGFQGEFDPAALPIYLASIPLVLATAMLVALAFARARAPAARRHRARVRATPVFELAGAGGAVARGADRHGRERLFRVLRMDRGSSPCGRWWLRRARGGRRC